MNVEVWFLDSHVIFVSENTLIHRPCKLNQASHGRKIIYLLLVAGCLGQLDQDLEHLEHQ